MYNTIQNQTYAKLVFDVKIATKNGVIFCAYLQREHKIAATLANTGTTVMIIKKAHIMIKHHDKEQTHRIVLESGWPLKKRAMMPCKTCSIGKVR